MAKAFKPGRGYTKADWDAVDSPKLTKAQMAKARPFTEVFPDLAATIKRGRPKKAVTKKQVTLRLSPEVVDHFKAGGPGWQSRIDEALIKIAAKKSRKAA